jgi:hypothetical protein
MSVINEASKSGSEIALYVQSIENLYKRQSDKINFMMTRLYNFKALLKEEQMLADKFAKIHEQQYSMSNSLVLEDEANILDEDF